MGQKPEILADHIYGGPDPNIWWAGLPWGDGGGEALQIRIFGFWFFGHIIMYFRAQIAFLFGPYQNGNTMSSRVHCKHFHKELPG